MASRDSGGAAAPGSQPTLPPQPIEPAPLPTGTTEPRCPGNQIPCGAGCCCPGETICYGAACVDEGCDFGGCNATNCPSANGFDCVNGGCFQVTSSLSWAGCPSGRHCMGDVDGSTKYLWAVDYYEGNSYADCSSNAQCPSGTACYASWICVTPC